MTFCGTIACGLAFVTLTLSRESAALLLVGLVAVIFPFPQTVTGKLFALATIHALLLLIKSLSEQRQVAIDRTSETVRGGRVRDATALLLLGAIALVFAFSQTLTGMLCGIATALALLLVAVSLAAKLWPADPCGASK